MNIRRYTLGLLLLLSCHFASAQQFYNLTAQQVKIDSVLPLFTYTQQLGAAYADSVYTVSIEYPEFIDMSETDVARYQKITGQPLPAMPAIEQYIGVSRKQGTLYVAFVPLVFRDGKYKKLVSFKLSIEATCAHMNSRAYGAHEAYRAHEAHNTYAAHSVLATGRWAKIRVPSTGVYRLTSEVVSKAGFSDINKVKIYGYGGAMQPELLTADYLATTDDLKEVPTCTVGGKRLFYAAGPVKWESNTSTTHTRNPYSDYGYYFLTENDSTAQTISEEEFKAAYYPTPYDYHALHEVDDYSWYHGGRNLYDSRLFGVGVSRTFQLAATAQSKGKLTVALTSDGPFAADVLLNSQPVGTVSTVTSPDKYSRAISMTRTFTLTDSLQASNTVTITQTSGANMRLDYVSLCFDAPLPWTDLTAGDFPAAEYVYNITNQDHHADTAVDMVIIIPTTQKLLSEAQRIQAYHELHDSLRVRIVPADELFNEFSSGTPDANAYRRYLKMLYDRAETETDMPRFLLLFGDGAWDNRMLTSNWSGYSPDDFLLCYESENSFSETDCYVTDDYFCLMDDGEGGNMLTSDKPDVAVGRFPVRDEAKAKIMVDKAINYMNNEHAGNWQNTICFMGDDGDSNRHMNDAETVATMVAADHPAINLKKIYWDAYTRQSSSTGFSYPDVTRLIKQQMQNGALIMNYSGHGAPYTMSHEQVMRLTDFTSSTSTALPLWLTASCDIMPFDGQQENIGEAAILNKNGGALAFYGTTRTVYAHYNQYMNRAFTRYVLGRDEAGVRYTVGEAARLAKNLLMTATSAGNDIGTDRTANKLQYTLLGDPALTLAVPTMTAVIDSIDGQPATTTTARMLVGRPVSVKGHIENAADFNGTVTVTVRDIEQTIVCKQNAATDTAFKFRDRPNTLYVGSDSIRNGRFTMTFTLPKDISYSDGPGQMTVYALSSDKRREAHGYNTNFTMSADSLLADDGIGPNIYCYLNSSSFVNGGNVNATPFFYAELSDKDGINSSGNGIGHDLELIIDGEMSRTYQLNDYFTYDFGDYRSGNLSYSIPELAAGQHQLLFRAWDMLNNSSVVELQFNVVKGLEPTLFSVDCTKNPATTTTTFIVTHDRTGSQVDVELDIFDMSGRQLWKHTESGISSSQAYTIDWDLTTTGGHRLQTGVYLYRVLLSSDGSTQASKAKKLIIL